MPLAPASRVLVTFVATIGLLLMAAAPAAAHVEATASAGARAGEGPVMVAFSAAAESPSAGIAGIKAQLPPGVPPSSVTLAAGPTGWTLTPTADGYQIVGPALPPGTDAEFAIAIQRLPVDATVLSFKTLVRYTDGSEDAWIEEPTADNPDPQNPAPVITVAAAAPATSTVPSTPTSAPVTSSAATPTTTAQAPAADDDGTPVWPFTLVALSVVALVVGLALWRFRRRSRR